MNTRRYPILRFTTLAALASAGLASYAKAQTKENNTTPLNQSTSWVGGVVPTAATLAVFDNTLTSASATPLLGGNLSVLGINVNATPVSAVSRQWQIGNTVGATLTIFGSGITKAANTSAFILSSAVALGANQTWTLNAVTGTGTGNLQMNGAFSDGGNTLAVTGAGTFDLRGSNTFGSNVTIDTTASVNSATATVVFGGAKTFNTLNVPAGRVEGATIGNLGVASNFGDGGTNSSINLGGNGGSGVMAYTGNSVATNRTVTRDGRSAASGIEVTSAGQTLTISGALGSGSQVNTGTNGWVFSGSGNLTLNGVINNSTGVGSTGTTVTKTGNGTLTPGGANSYTGATVISGGTLLAAANNVIPSLSDLTLNGATYATGGFSNTARTLTNSGSSVLDMGSGTSILTFGDSNANSWAGTLTIWNWSGSLGRGGLDQIKFPSGGLSSGQVGAISFLNPAGLAPGTYGATLLSGGELVPVPEASPLLMSGLLGFLPLLHRRRPVGRA